MRVPLLRAKPLHQPGFGEKVETRRRFAEEHYLTTREQVKSGLERPLETPAPFRQRRQLAELPREHDDDAARLAEVGDAEDQALSFVGHGELRVEG